MKRGKKLLTLLLVLAVILGATYAATQINPQSETEEIVYTTVFSVNPDEVTQIGWDYSEPVSFTKEGDAWAYEEDAAFPVEEAYLDTMLQTLQEISSSKTIEAVEDWDQYTLEAPICEITVTAGDTTHTIKIGEETALGGERYLSIGDGNAYLVDSSVLDAFCYGLYDVLKMEAIPEITGVTGMERISDDSPLEIKLLENSGLSYSDEYVWFVGEKPLDTELAETLMTNVVELSWAECVNYHAEDLSKYGLDVPLAVIALHYTETGEDEKTARTFTLEIGAQLENGYYARIQGSNMVYRIASAAAKALLYTTYEELRPEDVLRMDWEQVNAIEVTLDGTVYDIGKGTKTVADEEGNETEEVIYTLDGEEIDAVSIPETLDAMESTGYASGLSENPREEIRFVIRQNHETFPKVELVFYRYDSSSCAVTLNGETTVFVSREAVVSLVETVNDLVLG